MSSLREERANERLRELQAELVAQQIDYATFRRRRTDILNELVGQGEDTVTVLQDARPPDLSEVTGRHVGGGFGSEGDGLVARLRRVPPVIWFIAPILLILLLLIVWPGESTEPAAAEGAAEDGAGAQPPQRASGAPEGELRRFATDADWSAADIEQFIVLWRSMAVEQRFELRLMPEYEQVRTRAQATLAAALPQAGSDPALAARLRELLRELE